MPRADRLHGLRWKISVEWTPKPLKRKAVRGACGSVRLGRQAGSNPRSAGCTLIEQTVMQPVFPPLPELDRLGPQRVASPVGWARNNFRTLELALELAQPVLELLPAGNRRALLGCPSAQPAAFRPRRKVGVRLAARDPSHTAFHAHLPLEFGPIEDQRRMRVFREFSAFSAPIVRVEDEVAFFQTLQ